MPNEGGAMKLRGNRAAEAVMTLCLLALIAGAGCNRTPRLSLQTRIDRAEPGTTISIDPGTYRESLRIDKSIVLEGAGTGDDGSSIVGSVGGVATIAIEGDVQVAIRNLTIQSGVGGIAVRGGATLSLERVRILDSLGSGLSLGDSASATLGDCTINRSGRNGISISGAASLVATACAIHESEAVGIAASTRGTVRIENSSIENSGECGLEILGGTVAELRHSDVVANGYAETVRTILDGAAQSGLWLAGSSRTSVEECRLFDNRWIGILVDERAALTMQQTEILACGGDGLLVDMAADVELLDCVVGESGRFGISLWGASHTELRATEISQSDGAGVLVAGVADAELYGCRVIGNHGGGVLTFTPGCHEEAEDAMVFIGVLMGVGNEIPGPDEAFGNTGMATCPEHLKGFLCRDSELSSD